MNKEKILTIDDMPMHKDTYFFGYGIDIEKPYEMANQIIKLREENKELKGELEMAKNSQKQASDSCRQHRLAIQNI